MHTERRQIATYTLALLLLMSATAGRAAEKLATPRLEDRVTDLAQVFSAERRKQLIDELAAYERETTNQIAILTIPTLSGEDIDAFALRVANEWGLGQKDRNNGILIVLAMQERRVWIEVGLGLESSISDEKAQDIIQSEMIPAFRKGDYAGGLEKGTHRLMQEARSHASLSFLECLVEARIVKFEKRADVDAEIAEALDLQQDAIGKLGVAKLEITVVKAAPKAGQNEDCGKLVGAAGPIVAIYELSNKAVRLEKGESLNLDYWAFAGFAPYGVPGKEVWTIRSGDPD